MMYRHAHTLESHSIDEILIKNRIATVKFLDKNKPELKFENVVHLVTYYESFEIDEETVMTFIPSDDIEEVYIITFD